VDERARRAMASLGPGSSGALAEPGGGDAGSDPGAKP
jgi:hypothetical protein